MCLSAKSDSVLRELAARLGEHLRAHPELPLADVAATLALGRAHFRRRAAWVVHDRAQLLTALDAFASGAGAPDGALAAPSGDDELAALAARYLAGERIDFTALHTTWTRLSLPAYPFERRPHWIAMTERTAMPSAAAPPQDDRPHGRDEILAGLRAMAAELLGAAPEDVDPSVRFLELGADSIILLRASQTIRDRFGVEISVRQLFEDLDSLDRVADALVAAGEPADPSAPHAEPTPPAEAAKVARAPRADGDSPLAQIVRRQLDLMAEQLALLRGEHAVSAAPPNSPARPSVLPPFRPRDRSHGSFTPEQRAWIDAFTRRYNARTAGSRASAQRHRPVLADNRAVAGLRRATKDLLYPIVAVRSEGSRFWDVDGNEYVDLAMGFGVNLFGHEPQFVREALQAQMRDGMQIGMQAALAGRAAESLREVTGKERVCFVNTGSEAVMTALRLVRAATKRSRVVVFAGSYHGTFDGVLARASTASGEPAVPVSPGVLPDMVRDLVVLEYGGDASLAWIRAHADELAAVLVEGVQSRAPDHQPRAFVRELRELTRETGVLLVFDEVLTGFRNHPRGAQAFYGVDADVATYGKIVASGVPIGVVAGCAQVMDYVDGGQWSFGDDSMPRDIETAFFGGTFCKHPLAMAAVVAVLEEMQRRGPSLQAELNAQTERLAQRLNALFDELRVPIVMTYFGSLFRFKYAGDLELLYFSLIERGIYIWEARNCFLSTAHDERDLDRVVDAFRDALGELIAVGLIARTDAAAAPVPPLPAVSRALAPTDAQRELWLLAQLDPRASAAYNESVVLRLYGTLRAEPVRDALCRVVERHAALRAGISADGATHVVASDAAVPVEVVRYDPHDGELRRVGRRKNRRCGARTVRPRAPAAAAGRAARLRAGRTSARRGRAPRRRRRLVARHRRRRAARRLLCARARRRTAPSAAGEVRGARRRPRGVPCERRLRE